MDTLQQISAPIQSFLQAFEREYRSSLDAHSETLLKSLQHIRASQGKRVRPILVALIAQAVAGRTDSLTLESALAIEQLHIASLIHDDVIDLSPTRRGIPTLHTIYNNHAAVLVGDYVVASAFMRVAQTTSPLTIQVLARVVKDLSEGELLQIELTKKPTFSEEDYFRVISHKTASLFEACALLGAMSVTDPSDPLVECCRKLGELMGKAFQLKDDILDYLPSEKLGKPSGNDLKEGKLTLPLLYALRDVSDPEVLHIRKQIEKNAIPKEEIPQWIQWTIDKGGILYTEEKITAFIEESVQILQTLPESEEKQSLLRLAHFLALRDY